MGSRTPRDYLSNKTQSMRLVEQIRAYYSRLEGLDVPVKVWCENHQPPGSTRPLFVVRSNITFKAPTNV